ncbi:putative acyl-CoA dehydrogenase FadE [Nocardioides phosphati]|uniref:Acyl-CoA dehydrogenase FadE n=1 Tax=Nocardioides phosphati TaxID=1867775 RepID=A0ABQ2NDY2_9ACTN|nr:acyl-CoA dehydrogenase [Nocardioides phosphati]GGO92688.1 putative acyl-CoA dehydrogenase FadE [Nocardioides phosphati]
MARQNYELGLGIIEEHLDLADAVADLAENLFTADAIRSIVDAKKPEKFPPFWKSLVEYELLGLHISEELGGSGGGLTTLAVALEALGRHALPGAFTPTVLASALLQAAGGAATGHIAGLIDGTTIGAVAPEGATLPTAVATADGGVTVTGTWDGVASGDVADLVVLPVDLDGVVRWIVVGSDQLSVTPQDSVDVLRRAARVSATDLTVAAGDVLSGLAAERARSIAAVVLGAEATGLISWCVAAASEYAKIRVQFGRPIGLFQGIKHKCAWMAIALEQSRAAVWDAATAIDKGDDTADFAGNVAAVLVPDLAVKVAQDCIQAHGGIGFTWEHDAHLYYRRALALRALLGTREARALRVADDALAGNLRPLDIELPAEAETIRAQIRAELDAIQAIEDEDARLAALGDGGWVLPYFPKPYGRAAGPLEQVVIAQEIKAAGVQVPNLLMGIWALASIVGYGSEELKEEFGLPTLRGDIMWCQLFSEPGSGSDLASLQTKATKVEGGWKINGQKIWTSMAQFSDWGILIARTDPAAPKHEGITYFLLDMTKEGVDVRPLREMTGSALFNEVFFDDVFIEDKYVVGEVNDGWKVTRTALASERVALSGKMAAYANDGDLLRFAKGRDLSAVARHQLGDLLAESQAIDVMSNRIVLKQLLGSDSGTTASVNKLLAMSISQKIAEFITAELDVAGAFSVPGARTDHALEQLLGGRATTIYGGTTEVQLNLIGERMLGLPRDAEPKA